MRVHIHRTVVAAVGAVLLTGTAGAGPTQAKGMEAKGTETKKAEAKGKDVVVSTSPGMAKFDHRGDKVIAWDKKADGYGVATDVMWNLGGEPGTEGFTVRAKGAGTLKPVPAGIPEGKKVAIRLCRIGDDNAGFSCTAWHYGRA
ncbi:hypothetical protein ABZ840_07295 [Streptomyces sp. NPDC047117]|uniref:hypothetical protein n=1 Tax=Streptomyces sp. NPDC047117 TaxID=3155379 RepID=UPI00340E4DF4